MSHNFLNVWFSLSWKTKYFKSSLISRPGKVMEISAVNVKFNYAPVIQNYFK